MNLSETDSENYDWNGGVYQLEVTDRVQAGPEGISNLQASVLAKRTRNLHQRTQKVETEKAPLNSPGLTGTPTSPTAAPGANTQQIANAAFVQAAIAAINLGAVLNNAVLTGIPTAPTAANGNNTTQLATTAFVQAAIAALVNSSPATLDTLNELAAALGNDANFATTMANALAGKQINLLVNLSTRQVSGGNSLNNVVDPGEYEFGDGVLDKPCDYGYLKVWRESPQLVGQIVQNIFTGEKHTRVLVNGAGWLSWRKVLDSVNTVLGSLATLNNVSYNQVNNTLKSFVTLASGAVDLSAAGGGKITLLANTAFSFTNFELNKTYLLIITANGFTPSWSVGAKHVPVTGNESFGTSGVFYVVLTCIDVTAGSEKLLTTIMKGA